MNIPNKVYDILKWIAIIVLPALSTFIVELFDLWGIPNGMQIGHTITLVATLLGAILGISSLRFASMKAEAEENVVPPDEDGIDEEDKS